MSMFWNEENAALRQWMVCGLTIAAVALFTPTVMFANEGESSEAELSAASAAEEGEDASSTPENSISVGGALRLNLFHKSWDDSNQDKFGDLDVDTFRLNLDAVVSGVKVSAEYRFYSGYHMLHHGYFGHSFDNGLELQLGINQVPFGIQPYASHSWFFDIGYYVGLEDDYDMGLKAILPTSDDNLSVQLAFYKNDEGNFTGDSVDSARYSYDVVRSNPAELGYVGVVNPRTNEETNQFNARVAYTFEHDSGSTSELGFSGQYGQLYNGSTEDSGDHWAAAVHLNGTYGAWNLMLQATAYEYSPKNPVGVDDSFVVMGAYDFPYKVASEAQVYQANLSYTVPISWGPISSLTFYNDYSTLVKDNDQFEDSSQNVLGVLLAGGPYYIYVDAAFGENHSWLGGNYGNSFAEGDPNADWEMRFNVNFGYYF